MVATNGDLGRIRGEAEDYFGRRRTFFYERVANSDPISYFEDTELKVRTFYIRDGRVEAFPGREIANPPAWKPQSISAYANTCDVAEFFQNVLEYSPSDVLEYSPSDETIEDYTSSIQCVDDNLNQKRDKDAWWCPQRKQAFFGQSLVDNSLRCFAVLPDIVAHEFTHHLTSSIAKFEYRYESGALDESYADIFGILISNFYNTDIKNWDWRIGNGFGEEGSAFRNLQQPSSCNSTFTVNGESQPINHPEHMNDFLDLPYNQDYGGIHHNCSIHNHAAYKLLTSQDQETNEYLFDASTVAVLFYQALKLLGEQSGFINSRLAIESIAKTLFRRNSPHQKQKKLGAIAAAFDSVGILII